jgi:Lipase (class 3)
MVMFGGLLVSFLFVQQIRVSKWTPTTITSSSKLDAAAAQTLNLTRAIFLAEASNAAYDVDFGRSWALKNEFSPDRYKPIYARKTNIQGFYCWDDMRALLAFRGTNNPQQWLRDFTVNPRAFYDWGYIHSGFRDGIMSDEMVSKLKEFDKIALNCKDVVITGHSLGGALAVVAASRLKAEAPTVHVDASVYTFGQPKVGNDDFRKTFNEKVAPNGVYQFVNHMDIFPRALFWYKKLETTKYIQGRTTPILCMPALSRSISGVTLEAIPNIKVTFGSADGLQESASSAKGRQCQYQSSLNYMGPPQMQKLLGESTGIELSDSGAEPDFTEADFKKLQEMLREFPLPRYGYERAGSLQREKGFMSRYGSALYERPSYYGLAPAFMPFPNAFFSDHRISEYIKHLKQLLEQSK